MMNHLLKIDKSIVVGLVALVNECQVLEKQRNEWNAGRCQFGHECSVRAVVPRRVQQRLELCELSTKFRGDFLNSVN